MRRGRLSRSNSCPQGWGLSTEMHSLGSPHCTFPTQQLSPQCGGQVFILEETAPRPPTLLPIAARLILSCTQDQHMLSPSTAWLHSRGPYATQRGQMGAENSPLKPSSV